MSKRRRGWCRWAVIAALTTLAGCGGGGGGGDSGGDGGDGDGGTVSGSFQPAVLAVESVDRAEFPGPQAVNVLLDYTGTRDVWAVLEEATGLVVDVEVDAIGPSSTMQVTFAPDRPVGRHQSELLIHLCYDEACADPVPGSPVRLPLQLDVLPNIEAQDLVLLSRSGREPAPATSVPVVVPASAGPVEMTWLDARPGLRISWHGDRLDIETDQLRAGVYESHVELVNGDDTRYRKRITVRYVVEAPPGGEQALSVTPADEALNLFQGGSGSRRFTVQRPTWTDIFEPPELLDADGVARLIDLGDDEYELAVDTAGLPTGSTFVPRVRFDAGPYAEPVLYSLTVNVGATFAVSAGLATELTALSTAADLELTADVTSLDGAPQHWMARSLSSKLTLLSESGAAGVDPLRLRFDIAGLMAQPDDPSALIEVSSDRDGTTAQQVHVSVSNRMPELQQVLRGPIVGSRARLYIDGRMWAGSQLLSPGLLQVEGATLAAASLRSDSRYVGDVSVLRVDVEDAVPGQDIVVRAASPLWPTQVSIPVVAATAAPAGHATLPYGDWRPPQFARGLDALYFAGDDRVMRWAHDGAQWSLSSVSLPGLGDVAVWGDGRALIAVGGYDAYRLHPQTLAIEQHITRDSDPANPAHLFDTRPAAGQKGLVFGADGAALVAMKGSGPLRMLERGVAGVGALLSPLTGNRGAPGDPGHVMETLHAEPDRGAGAVRSPDGSFVLAQGPTGWTKIHDSEQRAWVGSDATPAGTHLVAVSNDGAWRVRDDGALLHDGGVLSGRLGERLPEGFEAGGYGVDGAGRRAFVYGYRIGEAGGAPRALEAAVWVFDIRSLGAGGIDDAALLAHLPLPAALGCTTALVAGETCAHRASMTLADGDTSLFVLGPRGVASMAVPTLAPLGAASRKRALAAAGKPASRLYGPQRWLPAAAGAR